MEWGPKRRLPVQFELRSRPDGRGLGGVVRDAVVFTRLVALGHLGEDRARNRARLRLQPSDQSVQPPPERFGVGRHQLHVAQRLPRVVTTRSRADAVVRQDDRTTLDPGPSGVEHLLGAVTTPVMTVDRPPRQPQAVLAGHLG